MYCYSCGRVVSTEDDFCSQCGTRQTRGSSTNSTWCTGTYLCTSIHWSQTSEPKHKNGRQRATKSVKCIEHFTYEEIELDICMAVRKDALTGLLVDCFKRNSTPKCWHSYIGAQDAGMDKRALTYDQFLQFRRQKGDERQVRFVPNKLQKKHRPVSVSFL